MKEKRDGASVASQWMFRPRYRWFNLTTPGTYHEVMPVTGDVNLDYWMLMSASGGNVSPRMVIDGNTLDVTFVAGIGTWYYIYVNDATDALVSTNVRTPVAIFGPLYGQSVRLLCEDATIGDTLDSRVRYQSL